MRLLALFIVILAWSSCTSVKPLDVKPQESASIRHVHTPSYMEQITNNNTAISHYNHQPIKGSRINDERFKESDRNMENIQALQLNMPS